MKKIRVKQVKKVSQATKTRRQQAGRTRSDIDKWIGTWEGKIGTKDLANLKRVITNGGKITTKVGRERIKKIMAEFDFAAGKDLSAAQMKRLNKNVQKEYKKWTTNRKFDPYTNTLEELTTSYATAAEVVEASLTADALAAARKKALKSVLRKNEFKNIALAKGIDIADSSIFDVIKGFRSDSEDLYEEQRELILEYNQGRKDILQKTGKKKMKDLTFQERREFKQKQSTKNLIHEWNRKTIDREY